MILDFAKLQVTTSEKNGQILNVVSKHNKEIMPEYQDELNGTEIRGQILHTGMSQTSFW